ncbi:MAG: PAS domain-containing protein, partial [Actinobacteria bacterium]|nr:PAS domain-containing protein [Actinomycetota bacterium]
GVDIAATNDLRLAHLFRTAGESIEPERTPQIVIPPAAGERLGVTERRFRTLIEQLPLVVYIDLPDDLATSVYTSPQLGAMLGFTLDEWFDNDTFWELIHPDDRERVQLQLEEQIATNGRFLDEYRFVARDGRIVWVRDESTVVVGDDGKPLYVQGYYLDITERHASEEALRVERE